MRSCTLANYFTIYNEAAKSPLAVAHKEGDDQHYWEVDDDDDDEEEETRRVLIRSRTDEGEVKYMSGSGGFPVQVVA